MSNSFYKPVVGAALVVAGDNLILQNRNMNSSLALGAAAEVLFTLVKILSNCYQINPVATMLCMMSKP